MNSKDDTVGEDTLHLGHTPCEDGCGFSSSRDGHESISDGGSVLELGTVLKGTTRLPRQT
jgi:hypothetical protein